MIVEEDILLIEEILKYEGTLFGKIWGLKGGGALPNEKSQFGRPLQRERGAPKPVYTTLLLRFGKLNSLEI